MDAGTPPAAAALGSEGSKASSVKTYPVYEEHVLMAAESPSGLKRKHAAMLSEPDQFVFSEANGGSMPVAAKFTFNNVEVTKFDHVLDGLAAFDASFANTAAKIRQKLLNTSDAVAMSVVPTLAKCETPVLQNMLGVGPIEAEAFKVNVQKHFRMEVPHMYPGHRPAFGPQATPSAAQPSMAPQPPPRARHMEGASRPIQNFEQAERLVGIEDEHKKFFQSRTITIGQAKQKVDLVKHLKDQNEGKDQKIIVEYALGGSRATFSTWKKYVSDLDRSGFPWATGGDATLCDLRKGLEIDGREYRIGWAIEDKLPPPISPMLHEPSPPLPEPTQPNNQPAPEPVSVPEPHQTFTASVQPFAAPVQTSTPSPQAYRVLPQTFAASPQVFMAPPAALGDT